MELWDSTAAAVLFASTGGSSWRRDTDSFCGGACFSLVPTVLRFSLLSSISASRIICAMKSSDEMGVAVLHVAAALFALFFGAVEPHPERA